MTSFSRAVSAPVIYAVLAAGAVITLAPFALGLLTSFTSAEQFDTGKPLSWPKPPTLENYTGLADAGFGRALVVTALMTAVILVGQLTFSVFAAYAFARLEFPGRDALFWVYLATLMVPATVTVVPLYLMMAQAGLRNTFWALVLPFMFGSPYAIFLLREYFRGIPADLIKAARIDGANTLDVLVHVVVPASRPILVTLALITVVSQWNSFMWPLVITSGGTWQVLTVATAGLQSRYNAQWTLVMAATTVAIVPLIVLFVALGRHIVPLHRGDGPQVTARPRSRFGGDIRPRVSTMVAAALALTMAVLLVAAVLLGRSAEPTGRTVVTVRLWDEQVAAAYRESFDEFTRVHPDIDVRVTVVPYATYFDTLRTDAAGGSADDIFWMSNAYFAQYADSGRLMDVAKALGPQAVTGWEPSVVDQFTRDGVLWGVPQLTDAGIAVYFNVDLIEAAGVDLRQLMAMRWSPGDIDTLRPLLARLTVDADGRRADERGFDAGRIRQWGYNAAKDLQGIYLDYIGSAGGIFSDGDRFAFDNPGSVAAFDYLVGLINDDHVSPPASDTNGNGDFSRNQFLQGKMALFQSGTYNLAAIAEQSRFRWGVVPMPVGPVGRVSVTNGIAAAGNSATKHPDAVRQVLAWMGSEGGNQYLGARGAAIPAVLAAQRVYFDYWARRGVDVRPFFTVLDGPRIPAPGGPGFPAGYQALQPYFDEMFLGRADVATTLGNAQAAANAAAER